ncbi:TatD family hydrolase [Clostridioides sp. ZZV14-6153]|uniref:TatD family hydrolase n=1 Tax=Clostridioides sp. ZZV14-6153 TaxID=2811494 RepID=UPI001D62ACC0|nr:TatD family hydrolase [Clostridioides sp. ZZV14-6153]
MESMNESLGIIAVMTAPMAYSQEVDFCKNNSNINVALGLHPQLIDERFNEITLILDKIQNVKYIGEVGLDFNNQYIESEEKQIEVFTNDVRECSRLGNKVLSIHSVKSSQYVLKILKSYDTLRNNTCILHWFTGNENQLRQAIELGCHFSINSKMIATVGGKRVIQKIP